MSLSVVCHTDMSLACSIQLALLRFPCGAVGIVWMHNLCNLLNDSIAYLGHVSHRLECSMAQFVKDCSDSISGTAPNRTCQICLNCGALAAATANHTDPY